MAFLDDLIKSSNYLTESIQGLALQRSLNTANTLAQQVKASEAKDEEKRVQLQQIAQNFTVDLLGRGISPDQILAGKETISPTPRMAQTPEQVVINPGLFNAESRTAANRILQEEREEKLGLLRQKAVEKKQTTAFKFLEGLGKGFQKQEGMDTIIEGMSAASQARAILDTDYASAAKLAARGIMKLVGEGSRMSDADISTTSPGRSYILQMRGWTAEKILNKISSSNKQELMDILDAAERSAKISAVRRAKTWIAGRKEVAKFGDLGIDENQITSQVLSGMPFTLEEVGAERPDLLGSTPQQSQAMPQVGSLGAGFKRIR